MILKVNLYWSWNGPGCTQKHHGTHESLWKAIFASYQDRRVSQKFGSHTDISHFYIHLYPIIDKLVATYSDQLLMYVVVLNNSSHFITPNMDCQLLRQKSGVSWKVVCFGILIHFLSLVFMFSSLIFFAQLLM